MLKLGFKRWQYALGYDIMLNVLEKTRISFFSSEEYHILRHFDSRPPGPDALSQAGKEKYQLTFLHCAYVPDIKERADLVYIISLHSQINPRY